MTKLFGAGDLTVLCALSVVACLTTRTLAQGAPEVPPPTGPADIMNRANAGRARSEARQATATGDNLAAQVAADAGATAASDAGAATAPAGSEGPREPEEADDGHGHGRSAHDMMSEPELPSAEPNPGTPPGTLEIVVGSATGTPLSGAEIVLGVMAGGGGRSEQRAKTDASGRYVFRDLPIGTQQAYRVNVLRDGAKFSSTPFRLSDESGFRVRMQLRETTVDRSKLFQLIGQTVVELRDDRLHITQQARLANAGSSVIVLPKEGLLVPLPQGFTAFQWQDQMTDQKGEESKGAGFRLRGSVPPGAVTLAWTFDLPREGASARIPISQPWRTYTYRVISEAPEGMKLRVSDFPEPERVKDQQRDLFFTQLQMRPSDPELGSFTIRMDGIPGPGPGRWIAVVLAALAAIYGLMRALRPVDDAGERKEALATRKKQLLDLAKSTESELERGEIGPQFRAERMNEILTELALVLRDEESLAPAKK